MQLRIEKAPHLIETLPYIQHFSGKTFVVKFGGAAMTDATQLQTIVCDIALLHLCGIQTIVVHGGGPDISAMCERLQLTPQFSNGLRITDANTMEIVQMVLLGKTNSTLVTALNQCGVKAVGISGQDAICLTIKTISADLGYVGDVSTVDPRLINTLLAANFLPVIAPIGTSTDGQAHNINADAVAGAIAGSLHADKLIILSDINGLYEDMNDPSTKVSTITKDVAKTWLHDKRISGGMVPKLASCIHALENGVSSVHIINGKTPHSLLDIFTDQGKGTTVS